ncbi:MAG: GNAT family N-acetyltransferase [Chthonomonadales bacterium]|nr:GNAT family N-acetyltransferase [Chthonomonadales bacterium]
MPFRPYERERDREAAHRIWREVGWLPPGREEQFERYVACGRALVADAHGQAECLVLTAPGRMRYLDEDLPISCVTGVTTGRVARKQGLAGALAARALAADAAEGMLVSALGMFEQGYYNQLGFGTGGYEHHVAFDPAHLQVPERHRVPRRLTVDDWEAVHAARLARRRAHGGVNLHCADITRSDMDSDGSEEAFGLGYADGPAGELTHCAWCRTTGAEHGPYRLELVWRTGAQLRELLALVRSLGDQVHLVKMREPAGVQMQDLLRQPIKHRSVTQRSDYESSNHALAYWQARILDLPGCLARTHLECPPLRLNLRLSDPVAAFLEGEEGWRGVEGHYVVTLGAEGGCEPGEDASLPTLEASVGAFTRLWLGVRPASGLAITDDLRAPDALLASLDAALRLPDPRPDWDF